MQPDLPLNQQLTIPTPHGPVDILFDLVSEGDTLHVKDVIMYGRGNEPMTGLLKELLHARSEMLQ